MKPPAPDAGNDVSLRVQVPGRIEEETTREMDVVRFDELVLHDDVRVEEEELVQLRRHIHGTDANRESSSRHPLRLPHQVIDVLRNPRRDGHVGTQTVIRYRPHRGIQRLEQRGSFVQLFLDDLELTLSTHRNSVGGVVHVRHRLDVLPIQMNMILRGGILVLVLVEQTHAGGN